MCIRVRRREKSTHRARVHDRVEACRDDRPAAPEDPVLRVGGRDERGDGQEFGEHREVKTVSAQINDCVEVRLKKVGPPRASESTGERRRRDGERREGKGEREREEEERPRHGALQGERSRGGGLGGGVRP